MYQSELLVCSLGHCYLAYSVQSLQGHVSMQSKRSPSGCNVLRMEEIVYVRRMRMTSMAGDAGLSHTRQTFA